MAVAVHLVEVLTVITVLGLLISCTVIVVIAEQAFRTLLYVIWVSNLLTMHLTLDLDV